MSVLLLNRLIFTNVKVKNTVIDNVKKVVKVGIVRFDYGKDFTTMQ